MKALARACIEVARELCLAAIQGDVFNLEVELVKLRELAAKTALPRSLLTS